MNKIRQEESKPILTVDAGAMLYPQPHIAPSQLTAKTLQAKGLIKAMTKMGYDAFGLAPQDLSAGSKFLLQQPPELNLPWLSMNLIKKDSRELLFAPYLIKTVGDMSVGVLSLTGIIKPVPNQIPYIDFRAISWEKTLGDTIAQVKSQTDMIILLSSLTEKTNREIAEKFPEIHLIIQSGQSTKNIKPQLHGNTLVTQIGSRGKYIGRLDIQWAPSGTWSDETLSKTKQIRDRLDRVKWQIGRLAKRYQDDKLKENTQYQQLLLEKERLADELQELESQKLNTQAQYSTFKSSFIGLPVSLPEDPEVREIVLKTKLAVNKKNQRTLTNPEQKQTTLSIEAFSNLAGWKACQTCHEHQTNFWQKTAHAKAWQTLVKAKQHFNPDCLICHVTLPTYDKDTITSNNLLANLKEDYKSVGCEACHGAAKKHAQQPEKYRPRKPDELMCLTCHTPERDNSFIFSEKLKKIRCPASGH